VRDERARVIVGEIKTKRGVERKIFRKVNKQSLNKEKRSKEGRGLGGFSFQLRCKKRRR